VAAGRKRGTAGVGRREPDMLLVVGSMLCPKAESEINMSFKGDRWYCATSTACCAVLELSTEEDTAHTRCFRSKTRCCESFTAPTTVDVRPATQSRFHGEGCLEATLVLSLEVISLASWLRLRITFRRLPSIVGQHNTTVERLPGRQRTQG